MSELRQDRSTGAWVLVAPKRGRRPQDRDQPATRGRESRFSPGCPFCPGNERKLAGIIEETPADAAPGWQVRVVPNLFPLVADGDPRWRHGGGAAAVTARGRHEVVIESPWHDDDLVHRSDSQIADLMETWHRRHVAMLARPAIRSVTVFRNRGAQAGASLRHPHSQVVGLSVVPPKLRALRRWGRARYRASGRCATCDALAWERAEGLRVVEESRCFVVLVPFAAAGPYEHWLVPKRHAASFGAASPAERAELAALLGRCLRRLFRLMGPVPYNWVIESAGDRDAEAPYLHWRLRIVPDLATPAGFEFGSGLSVNPSLPEADAAALRDGP